jgi:hypothetical protein
MRACIQGQGWISWGDFLGTKEGVPAMPRWQRQLRNKQRREMRDNWREVQNKVAGNTN